MVIQDLEVSLLGMGDCLLVIRYSFKLRAFIIETFPETRGLLFLEDSYKFTIFKYTKNIV
jgi:hypothetical protein